ncbi:hypothetical protein BpHYR1_021338 [Brachionus plicatilis]|uniref:Uncharacterized protein n=1 Tax=Brachionus plicatilis TaxID=10195 RepID=A0A3M7Q9L9_BRAPC|nr:hypothetical protein BpHYR1_021338 [Brachionus plicatilis]
MRLKPSKMILIPNTSSRIKDEYEEIPSSREIKIAEGWALSIQTNSGGGFLKILSNIVLKQLKNDAITSIHRKIIQFFYFGEKYPVFYPKKKKIAMIAVVFSSIYHFHPAKQLHSIAIINGFVLDGKITIEFQQKTKSFTQCYRDFETNFVNSGVSDKRAKNNKKEPED